jgi:hypothetical protein
MLKYLRSDEFSPTFYFNGGLYEYNRHPYNNAGERSVEIPIASRFLNGFSANKQLCEVGNVLANYEHTRNDGSTGHRRRIVDKYEVSYGIDNVDILDISEENVYDGIVSVSTLEHVCNWPADVRGTRDLDGPLKAIAKCYDLLKANGRALITVPFGRLTDGNWYIQFGAEYLARLTNEYGVPSQGLEVAYLKREAVELVNENPRQQWRQAKAEELIDAEYAVGFDAANGIAVITLTKVSRRQPSKSLPLNPDLFWPGCLIGSVYDQAWKANNKPTPDGYFRLDNCGPILTLVHQKPQEGEYELSFALTTKGEATISVEGRAFAEGISFSGYPLFRHKATASVKLQMRLTLPAKLEAIELFIVNHMTSQGAVRIDSFIVRRSHKDSDWYTAI